MITADTTHPANPRPSGPPPPPVPLPPNGPVRAFTNPTIPPGSPHPDAPPPNPPKPAVGRYPLRMYVGSVLMYRDGAFSAQPPPPAASALAQQG